MRINYDFGDLEAFLALVETGSFARAAEGLNLSQSAFSRRIQKLEAALGTALFERTTRSVAPTLQGRAFVEHATALLDGADRAARALGHADEAGPRRPTVTVAAVPTATQTLLPQAIRRYRDDGGRARIRIKDVTAAGVVDAVVGGEADFGVGFLAAQEPDLEFQVIADDPFVLAAPPGDPLAGAAEVSWRDIDPERFIAIWRGSGNRLLIEAALAEARIALDWSFEAQHLSTALGLVQAGLGVAALPRSAVPAGALGGVSLCRLTDPAISRAVGLVRRRRARLPDAAETLFWAFQEGAA